MSRLAIAEAYLEGCNHARGLTLRDLRERRELSIREVEEATAINRATLSKIERGIEAPTTEHLGLLSELYRVPNRWRALIEYRLPADLVDSLDQGGTQ